MSRRHRTQRPRLAPEDWMVLVFGALFIVCVIAMGALAPQVWWTP